MKRSVFDLSLSDCITLYYTLPMVAHLLCFIYGGEKKKYIFCEVPLVLKSSIDLYKNTLDRWKIYKILYLFVSID